MSIEARVSIRVVIIYSQTFCSPEVQKYDLQNYEKKVFFEFSVCRHFIFFQIFGFLRSCICLRINY